MQAQRILGISCIGLSAALSITTQANAQTGSLGGTVFDDANANGVQDAGEALLDGWTVQLIDATGAVVDTTATDGLGQYQFSDRAYGPYVVRQVPPTGWTQTFPSFKTSIIPSPPNSGPWDYVDGDDAEKGPTNWPDIAPDAGGDFQSPIDVGAAPTTDLSEVLSFHYDASIHPEKLKNNGHNVEVEYPEPSDNHITIGGEDFELLQFHFHHESEHAIGGQLTPMELHMVHRHEDGGLAVVGVTIAVGQANTELAGFFDELAQVQGLTPNEIVFEEAINLLNLLPASSDGWYYNGSLTTPPATQGVNWFLFQDSIEVSAEQLGLFEDFLDSIDLNPNNRPLQLLNGRQLNEINHQVTLNADNDNIAGLDFGNSIPEPATATGLLGLITLTGEELWRRRRMA